MIRACFVEAAAGSRAAVQTYLASLEGGDVSVAPIFVPTQLGATPDQMLQQRLTVWLPIAIAAMILAIYLVLNQSRRNEWALYRLLRAPKSAVLAMNVWEAAFQLWGPAATGTVIGLIISVPISSPLVVVEATSDAERLLALLVLAPIISTAIISRGSPFRVIQGG
jgi:hypothetical protein